MLFSNKTLLLLVMAMLLAVSSVFAGGQQDEAPAAYTGEEGRITVYWSGPQNMLQKLEEAFEKDRGDVLDCVQMGCGPLRQRVWTEMESGGIQADVFWGSDPLVYIALDEQGALDDYQPAEKAAMKDVFQIEDNFTLVGERYGVIIYNKDVLTENDVPQLFSDLTDAKYEGGIIHADPAQSSTALALVCGLWDVNGRSWDGQQALVDNGLVLTKKNSDVPNKIQEGEFEAGIAPHDAVIRLLKKAKKEGYPTPLAISWPQEGALAIQRPVAISRNESRPEENQAIAEAFVDFLISPKIQKMMSNAGFVSVLKDIPATPGVPENLNIHRVDWHELADQQEDIREGFASLFE